MSSSYFDGKGLFDEPKVTQFGSHMIMENVHKDEKKEYLTLDTVHSLNSDLSNNITKWEFKLADPIQEVTSMKIVAATIPLSWHQISESLQNSYFAITTFKDDVEQSKVVIKVDDSEYLETTLISEINSKITALITEPGAKKPVFVEAGFSSKPGVKITVDNTGGGSIYHYIVDFAVDKHGNTDKYNIKAKLGYALGFRKTNYSTKDGDIEAEKFVDILKRMDVYVAVEDFTTGYSSNYKLVQPDGGISRDNVIAKIRLDYDDESKIRDPEAATATVEQKQKFALENTLHKYRKSVSEGDNLISGLRKYSGKTTLQKFAISLRDKFGNILNLNGMDFDITLEVNHL